MRGKRRESVAVGLGREFEGWFAEIRHTAWAASGHGDGESSRGLVCLSQEEGTRMALRRDLYTSGFAQSSFKHRSRQGEWLSQSQAEEAEGYSKRRGCQGRMRRSTEMVSSDVTMPKQTDALSSSGEKERMRSVAGAKGGYVIKVKDDMMLGARARGISTRRPKR